MVSVDHGPGAGQTVAVGVLRPVVTVDDDADATASFPRSADDHAVGDSEERGADRDRDVDGGVVVVRSDEPFGVLVVPASFDRERVVAADRQLTGRTAGRRRGGERLELRRRGASAGAHGLVDGAERGPVGEVGWPRAGEYAPRSEER